MVHIFEIDLDEKRSLQMLFLLSYLKTNLTCYSQSMSPFLPKLPLVYSASMFSQPEQKPN